MTVEEWKRKNPPIQRKPIRKQTKADIFEATQALIDFLDEECDGGQSYLVTPDGTELITDWGYFYEGLELLNEYAKAEEKPRKSKGFNQKPMTNADRLRAMADEELAKKMSGLESFALTCGGGWPPEKWLDWLRKEVEE